MKKLYGVITAMTTPFTEEGEVCYDVLKLLLLEAESNKKYGDSKCLGD